MIESNQKFADAQYSSTAALLIVALIFSPAVLILSRPLGQASVSLALAFSCICVTRAWFVWAKDSHRPRLSVVTQPNR